MNNQAADLISKQLEKQFETMQRLLKKHEQENDMLQKELKNIQNKKQDDTVLTQQKQFQFTLKLCIQYPNIILMLSEQ